MNDEKDVTADLDGRSIGAGGGAALRGVGLGCGLLVAVPVLVVLGYLITYSVQRGTPEEYERVSTDRMAGRLSALSQEAYGVLGLDGDPVPGTDPDPSDTSLCYPGGLESIADEPVDGAYSLTAGWEVDGVPAAEAGPALDRLHEHLRDEGWDIDAYEKSAGTTLRASREGPSDDGGDIRLVFDWWGGGQERLTATVVSPCAYDTE